MENNLDVKVKKDVEQTTLETIKPNDSAIIIDISSELPLKIRLMELGFVAGTVVKVLNISPYKNSFLLEIRGSCIALRKSAVKLIKVAKL